jgi:hypothetical protein
MSVEMNVFNASITVTELLTKTLESCAKDLASRCIKECALRHGFDAEEEIRILGLENLSLIKRQMAKKTAGSKKEKKEKVVKETKEKKSTFPLPFSKESVNMSGCHGLAYNRGLFTQCEKKRMENGEFCKSCQSEADKNASGSPDCGNVCDRIATGLYEFKDPKGRSPTRYVKVLNKLKLSETDAMENANKLNVILDYEHFVAEDAKKTKGRPKKSSSVIEAENVTDLFAKLTVDAEDELETDDETKPKKGKLSDEEKAEKKAKLEAEKEAKKAEREAAKAAEKEEKKAKLEAEKEAKKAEKEAKIAAEKAEREAKRLKEKEEKAAAKKAEKEAKKESGKGKKSASKKEEPENKKEEPEKKEEQKSEKASAVLINGKKYLKTADGTLYDASTKEAIGVWNAETKTIDELPEDEDEEEEEEYEEL